MKKGTKGGRNEQSIDDTQVNGETRGRNCQSCKERLEILEVPNDIDIIRSRIKSTRRWFFICVKVTRVSRMM
jgi:methionyl-tRNA synthetase